MTGVCGWLVDVVARTLQPEEREAVLGDFAESRESDCQALGDLLGLVGRRQAALWMDWRPWLALFTVVLPLSILLSVISRGWAAGSAIYAWLYVNNWTWGYLESPGARRDLLHYSASFSLDYFTLFCWSWTSGYVLGSLSRRTIAVNGALFCVVLFGELLAVPQRHNPANAAVFSLTFYSMVFPLMLRTMLVLVPVLWGMQRGARRSPLPLLPTLLWAVTIATLTAWTTRRWQLWLLPLALVWPITYMVVTASWQRWRGRSVAA
jgi:hypothetical protein